MIYNKFKTHYQVVSSTAALMERQHLNPLPPVEGFVVYSHSYVRIKEVKKRTMPYLTNNQRMELGLEGACCVKPETLKKADTSKVYVDEEMQEHLLTPPVKPEPVKAKVEKADLETEE